MDGDSKVIRLTWAQIIWGVTVIFILGMVWSQVNGLKTDFIDLRTELRATRQDAYTKTEVNDKETRIYAEINRAWDHINNLESSMYGKARPK